MGGMASGNGLFAIGKWALFSMGLDCLGWPQNKDGNKNYIWMKKV